MTGGALISKIPQQRDSRRRILGHRLLVYLLCPILTHITLAMPEAHSGGLAPPLKPLLNCLFWVPIELEMFVLCKVQVESLADAWAYCRIRLNPVALLRGTVSLLTPRITTNPLLSGLIPPLWMCTKGTTSTWALHIMSSWHRSRSSIALMFSEDSVDLSNFYVPLLVLLTSLSGIITSRNYLSSLSSKSPCPRKE